MLLLDSFSSSCDHLLDAARKIVVHSSAVKCPAKIQYPGQYAPFMTLLCGFQFHGFAGRSFTVLLLLLLLLLLVCSMRLHLSQAVLRVHIPQFQPTPTGNHKKQMFVRGVDDAYPWDQILRHEQLN